MRVDPVAVADEISVIAKTYIMPRFNALQPGEVHTKSGPTDLVTIADIEAEKALISYLEGLVPGSRVIGEEGVAQTPALLDHLVDDGIFWIVDPVDGTGNFVAGKEKFGTMVALIRDRETIGGWIYAPCLDACAVAELGAGACWEGARLQPHQPPTPLATAKGDITTLLCKRWTPLLTENLRNINQLRAGRCAAFAYLDLICGQIDFSLVDRLKPWDHAAGALLLQETGGRAAYIASEENYIPRPNVHQLMLCTACAENWPTFAHTLRTGPIAG